MKKNLIFLVISLFTFSSVFSQPKIEISNNAMKDWGKVSKKENPLQTQFKIYNKGNKVLKVYAVKPTCGCTTAPLDKNDINPGEYATMNVTLQINKDEGKVKKFISVTSNDPKEDKKDIELNANILVPFSFFPNKNILFGTISRKKENIGKIVITNNLDNDIRILSVKVLPSFVKVNLKAGDKIKPGQDFVLVCSFKNPKLEGKFDGKVTIQTTDPDMPLIELNMYGIVGSD